MSLANIQLFIEVVRRGSFAAVARDRNIASSSVSRAVAALEEELGTRLFQRTTRRLELTEAGRRYFDSVEDAIEALALAGERAAKLSETPRGILRVTASATFGQMGIVPLLPELTRRFPELSIELLLTDNRLDLVAERIDVAIRIGQLLDTTYVATRLGSTTYHVCASPKYLARRGKPVKPADLARHDCLQLYLSGYGTWRFRNRRGKTETIAIGSRVAISNVQAIKQCILADMGIALLPEWMVRRELASGELVALFGDYDVGAAEFEIPVWLLYPSRRHLPMKVRAFTEFVQECFKNAPPWSLGM